MDLGLKGKTALVLGAGGGLGGAMARAIAREGANVALGDIAPDAVEATAKAIRSEGGIALPLTWDLADLGAIDAKVSEVEAAFGRIDILVNNTGGPPPSTVSGQDPAVWEKHFNAMVMSVIALTDRVLPAMREQRWGRILTSASSGVVAPIPSLGLSNALRMALVGWSKTLAREVGPDGITSNLIIPGRIATQRITFLDEQKARREGRPLDEVVAESLGAIPVGRYGKPEEYADTAAFLVSERAAYITGSVLRVDGGYIASV